ISRIANLFGRLLGFDQFADLLSQYAEIFLLIAKHRVGSALAVSRADHLCSEFLGYFYCRDPFLDITVIDEIVWSVHASVAGEEDLLIWKPRECIAVRVRHAQMNQFDTMFAVVKNHLAREEHRGRFEF